MLIAGHSSGRVACSWPYAQLGSGLAYFLNLVAIGVVVIVWQQSAVSSISQIFFEPTFGLRVDVA